MKRPAPAEAELAGIPYDGSIPGASLHVAESATVQTRAQALVRARRGRIPGPVETGELGQNLTQVTHSGHFPPELLGYCQVEAMSGTMAR